MSPFTSQPEVPLMVALIILPIDPIQKQFDPVGSVAPTYIEKVL
jgi:hypothetical protein